MESGVRSPFHPPPHPRKISPHPTQVYRLRPKRSAIGPPPSTTSARSRAAARPGRGGPGEIAIPPVKETVIQQSVLSTQKPFPPTSSPTGSVSPHNRGLAKRSAIAKVAEDNCPDGHGLRPFAHPTPDKSPTIDGKRPVLKRLLQTFEG